MKKLALILALLLVPFAANTDSQGDNNGKPFQELQAAIDAALAAEKAAREAEDAALAAQIAAEEAARVTSDITLQAEIDANAAAIVDLENRVSVLEDLDLVRSVTWTETVGAFDVVNLAAAISGLNYQSGDWIFVVSRNAYNGREFGNCTNSSRFGQWLTAAATGGSYGATVAGTYFYINGSWYSSPTVTISTGLGSVHYLRVYYAGYWGYGVWEHFGNSSGINQEVQSYYSSPSFYYGNGLTINVGKTRLEACGF